MHRKLVQIILINKYINISRTKSVYIKTLISQLNFSTKGPYISAMWITQVMFPWPQVAPGVRISDVITAID